MTITDATTGILDLMAPPDFRRQVADAIAAVEGIIEEQGETLRRAQIIFASGGTRFEGELLDEAAAAGVTFTSDARDGLAQFIDALNGTLRLNEVMHHLHEISDPDGLVLEVHEAADR